MTRGRWLWVIAAGCAAVTLWALYIAQTAEVAGLFRDEGVYLVVSRSLAAGTGYFQTHMPSAPPEVRFPPLLPLLLAPVWHFAPQFPANLAWLKAVPALCGLGVLVLLPVYLCRIGLSAPAAIAAAALTALSPVQMRYATSVASELPFALLVLLTLLALERAAERGRPLGAGVTVGVCAALAFLTRSAGLAVIVAAGIDLARRTDRERVAGYCYGVVVTALPWVAWLIAHGRTDGDASYAAVLAADGLPSALDLLRHAIELPAAVALVTLPGFSDIGTLDQGPTVMILVYALGAVVLFAVSRHRFATAVWAILALSVAVPWFQPRFLVPVAPFLLAGFLEFVLPAPDSRGGRVLAGVVITTLLVAAGAGHQRRMVDVARTGMPPLALPDDRATTWDDYATAFAWLRSSTEPDAVVSSLCDPMLNLYTSRPATQVYPWLWRPEARQVTAQLLSGHTRYLVDVPTYDGGVWSASHQVWDDWLESHGAVLAPVFRTGRITIYRIEGPLGTPPPPTSTAAAR